MPFGKQIEKARKGEGWDLDELHYRSRVGLATLKDYESGKTKDPAWRNIEKIATALGVDAGWIMDGQRKRKAKGK